MVFNCLLPFSSIMLFQLDLGIKTKAQLQTEKAVFKSLLVAVISSAEDKDLVVSLNLFPVFYFAQICHLKEQRIESSVNSLLLL